MTLGKGIALRHLKQMVLKSPAWTNPANSPSKLPMLNHCIKLSYEKLESCTEKFRHFSFVIQRNEILSVGCNRRVSHDVIYPRQTYHSEYVAYHRGRRRIDARKPWAIVNVRIGNDLHIHLSKPCPTCQRFLACVGCSKVIYTIDERTTACMRL